MPKYLSEAEFEVALGDLQNAIGAVRGESGVIAGLLGEINGAFSAAESSWQSPAAATFEETRQWFTRASNDLHELLEEIADRMEVAYQNYLQTEMKNKQNVTPTKYDRVVSSGGGHNPSAGSGNLQAEQPDRPVAAEGAKLRDLPMAAQPTALRDRPVAAQAAELRVLPMGSTNNA